jgi:hypothetical protein
MALEWGTGIGERGGKDETWFLFLRILEEAQGVLCALGEGTEEGRTGLINIRKELVLPLSR